MSIEETWHCIFRNLKYRSGAINVDIKTSGNTSYIAVDVWKRQYRLAKRCDETSPIEFGIKEDGGTRTVFAGVVYTMEQFLMIDQLTLSH